MFQFRQVVDCTASLYHLCQHLDTFVYTVEADTLGA